MMITQLFIQCLTLASIYLLVSLAVALVRTTAGFYSLVHGALLVIPPFCVLALNRSSAIASYFAVGIGLLLVSGVGAGLEWSVFRWQRRRSFDPNIALIASLGLYVALQNVLLLFFGDTTWTLQGYSSTANIHIGSATVTPGQAASIGIGITCFIVTIVALRRSRVGRTLLAVGQDIELASIYGVRISRIMLFVFCLSSFLVGLAGILIAFDTGISPSTGMNSLLMGVVVAVVSSRASLNGLPVGALLLASCQILVAWTTENRWQNPVAFGLLVAYLLFVSDRRRSHSQLA